MRLRNDKLYMLNKIIKFCLEQRFLVLAATTAIIAWGGYAFRQLPVDVLPNLNRPTVTIFAEAEGWAPEEVENLVAFPLETAVNGSAGVIRVRSTSSIGLAIVNVEFDWDTDVYRNRQIVQEKIQATKLPQNVHVTLGPVTSLLGEVVWAGLTSPDNSVGPMELRSLADWTIRQKLLTIPGVSNVLVMGGEPKQYQILVRPERLTAFGLTIEDVSRAVASSNNNRSGGFLVRGSEEYPIRILVRSNRIEDLKQIIVAVSSRPITVADVADVVFAPDANIRGTASIEGKPGVIMRIIKQPDADTLTLTKKIDEVFAELAPSLPKGVKATTQIFRQEWFINAGLHNVYGALRDGTLMVVIILILFLMNLRTTAITLTAIPLSLLITMVIFKLTGQGINVMTLGGFAVAIGELVDDAIVDVENVFRRLRENAAKPETEKRPALQVIFEASSEVRNSIVYATIVVGLVFIPLLNLPGVEGRLIQPLGLAYLISLLASLVISLTVTPVLCYFLLPKYVEKRVAEHKNKPAPILAPGFTEDDGAFIIKLKTLALRAIRWSLRMSPRTILLSAGFTVLIGAGLFAAAGKESIPPFNEGSFTSMMFTPQGTGLKATNDLANEVDRKLLAIPGITTVAHTTGRADQDAHDNGANSAEFQMAFKESRGRGKKDIERDIQTLFDSYQNRAAFSLGQPITHRMQELLSGVRAPIVVKFYGKNLGELRQYGGQIEKLLASTKGVKNAQIERELLVPQVGIWFDRTAAANHGINIGMAAMDLETAFMGMPVAEALEGNERYPIVVKFDPAWRGDLQALAQTLVVSNHRSVPLSEIALVEKMKGQNKISHEATQRRIVVSAFVQDRDTVSIVKELKTKIDNLDLPSGYFVSYEGDYQSQKEASRRLTIIGVFVLLGIFGLLYWHFRSSQIALQIMFAIPTAFIGGMIAIWLSGGVVSTASLIGFVSLIGIVSRNGIMLVSHYLHLHREEKIPWGEELIIRGSLERVVPVAMTALTAALALIPLILAADESGKELLHPLAVVIFGGLVSSTLLEVFFHPGVFYRFGRKATETSIISQKNI